MDSFAEPPSRLVILKTNKRSLGDLGKLNNQRDTFCLLP